jgi:hypothetical protein
MKALVAFAVTAVLVSGCLSMQNQSTLDNVQEATSGSANSPYVEAFIEYVGPQARWAGPRTFSLHVVAREAGNAVISFTGDQASEAHEAPIATGRLPASQVQDQSGVTSQKAREHLAFLAKALDEQDTGFNGCLSPIRIRLVRADGGLLEKQGCRDQSSWSKTASEAIDFYAHAVMGEKGKN